MGMAAHTDAARARGSLCHHREIGAIQVVNRSSRFFSALVLSTVCLCALTSTSSAIASGGGSIASAPMLGYGQVTAGGGAEQEFWHLQLFSGDKITFIANLGGKPYLNEYAFTLYSPSITDYNLREAKASTEAALNGGQNEFVLTSPFSGLGTLDVCQGNVEASRPCGELAVDIITPLSKQADPYSFTASVVHATALTISAPTIARRNSTITVRATVSSPAGVPGGNCLIAKRLEPLVNGRCIRRIRLGRGSKQTVPVAFVPEDGWQATAGHRTIRVVA
jgi:hypothetical protein